MSNIQWTDKTANPNPGCSDETTGCKNCYAKAMAWRLQFMPGSKEKYAGLVEKRNGKLVWTGKVGQHESVFGEILQTKKPTKYFMNSMGDSFHQSLTFQQIDTAFACYAIAYQHTYQVLTKRAGRLPEYFEYLERDGYENITREYNRLYHEYVKPLEQEIMGPMEVKSLFPLKNVHLNVSAEDQKRYDERIIHLENTPAAVRGLSLEPLLGPIKLFADTDGCAEAFGEQVHWVIAGGESGPGARPADPEWIRSIRDQCARAGVAFFFKQWGKVSNNPDKTDPTIDALHPDRAKGGCMLDGVMHKEFPKTYKAIK